MAAKRDNWLSEYEACERLIQDIREKIEERDGCNPNDRNFSKANAAIRPLLKKLSDNVNELRQNLIRSVSISRITAMEGDRRQIKLDSLVGNVTRVEAAFKGPSTTNSAQRSTLLGNDFPLPRTSSTPWASVDSDDALEDITIDQARSQQQQVLQHQDESLDALSAVIARQKNLAYAIGHEADRHNEIIDDITDHVDRTRDRLIRETRHVEIVSRKSGTCWYWVVILVLLIAIIVIVAVPFK